MKWLIILACAVSLAACGSADRASVGGRDGTPPDASVSDGGATSDDDGGSSDAEADAPRTDGGPSSGSPACLEDGWCWERPTLFGTSLSGVWGSSFNDVWAVGRGGTILHFDGKDWTRLAPITPEPLFRVHGSGPKDVWAVGRRVVLHWDGAAWTKVATPATKGLLRTVHARAPGDVWFGGDWFALMHYDGSSFSLSEEGTTQAARAIVAFAKDDVWAVGDSAFVRHFDGQNWSWTGADFSGFPLSCESAWGTAANNVYLACGSGEDTVQRWNGSEWRRVVFPSGVEPGPAIVTGSSANDVWLISPSWNSASFDGNTWTRRQELENESLSDAWLDASGRGFAVGAGGRLLRRDGGTKWTAVSGVKGGAHDHLVSTFARADDDVWAVGVMTLLRYDGSRWNAVPPAPTTNRQEFGSVWASAKNDAWIAGWGDFPSSLQRWNGSAFSVVTGRPDFAGLVDAVWGTAANDVWIVNADGGVLHWNGNALESKLSSISGYGGGIHGTSANDVWLISNGLRRWNGSELKSVTLPPVPSGDRLIAVHALATDDVWVTAEQGKVFRWNGQTWTTPPVPALRADDNGNRGLYGFAGKSASDLWALGTDGDIFRFDGQKWTKSVTAGTALSQLTRTPSGALIAVGAGGAILRRR